MWQNIRKRKTFLPRMTRIGTEIKNAESTGRQGSVSLRDIRAIRGKKSLHLVKVKV
jgi:hypothetical protein